MTWLVFLLSGILIVAGAVSVVSGAPIIQIERGWAEVIAGSVAVSGGVIAFATGLVLQRLKAILRALTAERPATAAPAPHFGAESVGLRSTLDEAPPADPLPIPEPEPVAAAETPSPVAIDTSRVTRRRFRQADKEPESFEHIDLDRIRSARAASLAAPLPAVDSVPAATAPPAVQPSWLLSPAEEVAASVESPAPAVSGKDDEMDAGEADGSIAWLDQGLSGGRVPLRPALEPDGETAAFTLPNIAEKSREVEPVSRAADDQEKGGPVGEPNAVASAEVTIVGRYQAGTASYIMYSNGTIEVETEGGGLRHFDSMGELKDYIKRQEAPVG